MESCSLGSGTSVTKGGATVGSTIDSSPPPPPPHLKTRKKQGKHKCDEVNSVLRNLVP